MFSLIFGKMFFLFTLCLALVAASPVQHASGDRTSFVERDGTNFTVFEHAATGAKLEFVTNSGVCETTPGVNQFSGYLSVGTNMNLFFWFFEARNNPTTAPLVTWFNGGPGCSSMIGLFQENGPCHFVNGASTPSLNQFSFNEFANMLYVDQPVGTGFSFGTDTVDTAASAAQQVWTMLQAFYAQFPQYENRDFGLFTESYGGMYGPAFTSFFESQNARGAGEPINLVALGINNGWFDAKIGYKAQIDFLANNTYRNLLTSSQAASFTRTYTTNCLPLLEQCQSTLSDTTCSRALSTCSGQIEGPLQSAGNFDVYDVRASRNDPNPPETYVNYLTQASIQSRIGAQVRYSECPNAPFQKFEASGDDSRSYLSNLSTVVQSGVQTLIWAGDADWICNHLGVLSAANSIVYSGQSQFAAKALSPYTVNGVHAGDFKNVGNLSFLKVFGAGHEVPFYQPALALQVFTQTMQKRAIFST